MARSSRDNATAPAVNVRRWLRARQVAANGRVDPSTVYSVALAMGMVFVLVGQPVIEMLWPSEPQAGTVSGLVLVGVGVVLAGFFRVLRQIGPLSISRSDATWLLPAPVSRRMLFTPAIGLVASAAMVVGGLAGLAVAARIEQRSANRAAVLTIVVAGCAVAMLVALVAIQVQRRSAAARSADLAVGVIGTALLALAVVVQIGGDLTFSTAGLRSGPLGLVVAGGLLLITVVAMVLTRRGADDWPVHRIIEASATAGAYADAVYAVEPSFLTEASTRRFWRRRAGFVPSRLFRWAALPPLVSQDLIIVRRKAVKVWWMLGTAALPTVLVDSPRWLLIAIVLIPALGPAGLTAESTHSDRANPALLRLLGLSGRQVMAQRLVVPSVLAGVWCALALAGLQVAGRVDGPWWLLGLVAGPALAVAGLQRAKASATGLGSTLIETPLGAFPSGMLLWLANGVDVLAVLTLPISIGLALTSAPEVLGLHSIGYQIAASVLGCTLLVTSSAGAAGRLVN
ncbi:hypothetical protein E1258_13155 [Micromonospora sp. KC207]|uniref:DUF6297 family protein n=1 Tax=Micromonospora sp. KC207 TaxID=2530377 RepID=UPI0010528D8B|nr:DUF6297 family protein [Micromonospora sp. KC207]TDC60918.1 hypothetical protein E1258_13155 [Micromonospora sp. KC207]